MLTADRDDHVQFGNPYEDQGWGKYLWAGLIAAGLLAVAAIAFFVFSGGSMRSAAVDRAIADMNLQREPAPHEFSKVYEGLGVAPLKSVSDAAYNGLLKLEREPCEKQGIYAVAESVSNKDARWAAEAYYGFAQRCGTIAGGEMGRATNLFMFLEDYPKALIAANAALKIGDQFSPNLHYWRGQALAGLDRPAEAILEFQKTIDILGSEVGAQVYEDQAKAYVALGDYCKATHVFAGYISDHPNADSKYQTMAKDYAVQCSGAGKQSATGALTKSAELLAQIANEQPDIMMTVKGSCEKLIALGRDLTYGCHDTLLNTVYTKLGRTGFYFVSGDIFVTFSGSAKQIKPNSDTAVQPLDRIVWSQGNSRNTTTLTAVGTCRYTNPYAPTPTVVCHGETERGSFDAAFLSNGSPPVRIK